MAHVGNILRPRQKAFSHKVRSGCLTCKRRRVKCDEAKPACRNCVKGDRECLGYATPQPKIFIFESPNDSSSEISVDSSSSREWLLIRPPSSSFGNQEENLYLQHYLLITSPMIAQYGPQGEFFTVVVPQFAWESAAIKHMLLALSMTHKKFHAGVTTVSKDATSRALGYYVSAIADIRNNNPTKLEVAIASLVAWCMELMQNNLPAALIHLRASLRLLNEHKQLQLTDSTQKIVRDSIEPTTALAKGLSSLMLQVDREVAPVQPEYRDHLHAPFLDSKFSSVVEARDVVCSYIERIAAAENKGELKQLEKMLSLWFETLRKWDQESVRSLDSATLLVLFNTALALLPADRVAGFSYEENPNSITFVVDTATRLVGIVTKFTDGDEELKDTLRIAMNFVIDLFPDDPNCGRVELLLQGLRVKD